MRFRIDMFDREKTRKLEKDKLTFYGRARNYGNEIVLSQLSVNKMGENMYIQSGDYILTFSVTKIEKVDPLNFKEVTAKELFDGK